MKLFCVPQGLRDIHSASDFAPCAGHVLLFQGDNVAGDVGTGSNTDVPVDHR